MLENLSSILSSNRPDDAISGEIAEIVGFDDIEFVMEILNQRSIVSQEVDTPGPLFQPSAQRFVQLKAYSANSRASILQAAAGTDGQVSGERSHLHLAQCDLK